MPKYEGVYDDGRGGWYFKATRGSDPVSGKRVQLTRRGFRSAAEASRARRQALQRPVSTSSAASLLTVDQLLDRYLDGIDADGRLAPKTRYDYRRLAAAYVRPSLGPRRVRDVTPALLLSWQRDLLSPAPSHPRRLAPNTVRLARAPLAGALGLAVQEGLLAVNPLSEVTRPSPERTVPRHWTPEQARSFLDSERATREFPMWAFLLGTGLRIGELVALRWPAVELDRRLVRVVEFVSTIGYAVESSRGKSPDAVRTVELDEKLEAVLRLHRSSQEVERLVAGPADGAVFTTARGHAWHPQTVSKLLARRSVAAGLPRLTAHGLRHTSATVMLDEGVPPKVAAERLGHSDPALFIRLYSHVTPTMQRDAAIRVGAALLGADSDS